MYYSHRVVGHRTNYFSLKVYYWKSY